MVNCDGAPAGASKWNGAPPVAGSAAPAWKTRFGTYTARTPGVPARSQSTIPRSFETQNSVYQLHSGGWLPVAPPTPGVADPHPFPSGDSTTTPMLASVRGAV